MLLSVPFHLSGASQGSEEELDGAADASVDAVVAAVDLAVGSAAETSPITRLLRLMREDLLGPSTTILLDRTAHLVAGAEAVSGVKP